MPTKTETKPRPEGAKTGAARLVLHAVIKKTSKYFYQGSDEAGRPVAMEVKETRNDHYAFRLENGNDYRLEDLTFYVRGTDGKLVKLR